jgi:hypothetical protein
VHPDEVPSPPPPPAPAPVYGDPDYHCDNCLKLKDPTTGEVFWACQNLCIRE